MSARWDQHFMRLAAEAASMSKDPRGQVGAVAVRDRRPIATGFNGYPPGIPDVGLDDRDYKLARAVHAEANVIAWAAREGVRLAGATLYVWDRCPCTDCARLIAAAGVAEVVVPAGEDPPKWVDSIYAGRQVLFEAGVHVRRLEPATREDVA